MAPQPPSPPKFPTFEELLGLELVEPPKKKAGLLHELLGGSPMPIYQDAQEHPEKYRPEDRELLDLVVARGPRDGQWELNEDERGRLDQMVLTFATAKRMEPRAALRRPQAKKPLEKRASPSAETLPSFWWLRVR